MTTAPQATGLVALAERIELWPIDHLRPYERNPRTHSEAQVDQIAASMVEFGWTNPILIDENAGILAGHGRLLAARKLGLAEVPVIRFEHLSEAQKRAYLIADNQLALQAGWDEELLAEELAWLRDERFDLDLVGFDATELERLLAIADGETASRRRRGRGPGAAGGAGQQAGRPLGPRQPSPALRRRHGAGRRRAGARRPARGHDVLRPAIQRRLRQLAQGQAPRQAPPDPERRSRVRVRDVPARRLHQHPRCHQRRGVRLHEHSELHTLQRAFAAAGGKWSTFVIWAKNTFTLGRADYQRQYEPILYGWKDGADHYWCGARDQGDVWFFDKPVRNDLHPTMKPVALVERAIRNSSKTRDIVLDPFGGSGSTLIACEKTGRQARLIELDPKYVDTIILRWQEFSGGSAVLDGDGRSFEDIAVSR